MTIDRIETSADKESGFIEETRYDEALESIEDYGGNPISPSDRAQYDVVVEIEGQEYGLNASETGEGVAALQNEFQSEYGPDINVALTREGKGSASAGILTPNTETMTVREAVRTLNGD